MELEEHLQGIITSLGAGQRRTLAREIAADLRQRQVRRIASQVNPDGTAYAPKKPRLRRKSGRIRRGLFAKLRTTRYLRTESTADAAIVSIAGRAARIARVHQYGLTDRVGPNGPEYRYPERQILGIADADRDAIADLVFEHLTRGSK